MTICVTDSFLTWIAKFCIMDDLFCYVNGKRFILPRGRGECTLLEYLRGRSNVSVRVGPNSFRSAPPTRRCSLVGNCRHFSEFRFDLGTW